MNLSTSVAMILTRAKQLHATGAWHEAEQLYRQALEFEPNQPEAWHFLGLLAHQTGDSVRGAELLWKSIALSPENANFYCNLGPVLRAIGDDIGAEQAYRTALQLVPEFPAVWINLGSLLLARKQFAESADLFRRALEKYPDNATARKNLAESRAAHGVALLQQRNLTEAENALREAVALDATCASAWSHLGNVLAQREADDEAEGAFRVAVKVDPQSATAACNLGRWLLDQSRIDEAEAELLRAVSLDPKLAAARMNLALLWLLTEDYAQGWKAFESRFEMAEFADIFPPGCAARWSDEPISGRTILLLSEQGLGDTLQFIRYSLKLKQRGATVVAAVQPALVSLLTSCAMLDAVIPRTAAELPPHDYCVPLLSLPFLLKERDGFSDAVPYLSADPKLVEHWRQKLTLSSASDVSLRIGIHWQGGPWYRHDRYRSMPLKCFAPLAEIPGVQLFALQKGAGREQLDAEKSNFPLIDLGASLDESTGAFVETAAVLKNLDLLISGDTAIVHLAGAIGVPTWVPIGPVPDWRWHLHRSDSPFYPSLQLFRESRRNDWSASFNRIANEVRQLALSKSSSQQPRTSVPRDQ